MKQCHRHRTITCISPQALIFFSNCQSKHLQGFIHNVRKSQCAGEYFLRYIMVYIHNPFQEAQTIEAHKPLKHSTSTKEEHRVLTDRNDATSGSRKKTDPLHWRSNNVISTGQHRHLDSYTILSFPQIQNFPFSL